MQTTVTDNNGTVVSDDDTYTPAPQNIGPGSSNDNNGNTGEEEGDSRDAGVEPDPSTGMPSDDGSGTGTPTSMPSDDGTGGGVGGGDGSSETGRVQFWLTNGPGNGPQTGGANSQQNMATVLAGLISDVKQAGDSDGWGDAGNEGPQRGPLYDSSYTPIPAAIDDWGDIRNPRAMSALVNAFRVIVTAQGNISRANAASRLSGVVESN